MEKSSKSTSNVDALCKAVELMSTKLVDCSSMFNYLAHIQRCYDRSKAMGDKFKFADWWMYAVIFFGIPDHPDWQITKEFLMREVKEVTRWRSLIVPLKQQ